MISMTHRLPLFERQRAVDLERERPRLEHS
jgi:hypothetical protein